MEIKDGNYFVVQSFMVKDLKLKGLQRDVYAIIYGFSQAGQKFTGSLGYLSAWTCSSKQGVVKALAALMERNLIGKISKEINNIKFVEYYTTELHTIQLSLTGGIQLSCSNNIEIDNIDKESKGEPAITKPKRQTFDEIIDNFTENEETRFKLRKWLEVRKAKRAAMTNYAIELNLKKLNELARVSGLTVNNYLDEVIVRGWQAFFKINTYNNKPQQAETKTLNKEGKGKYD